MTRSERTHSGNGLLDLGREFQRLGKTRASIDDAMADRVERVVGLLLEPVEEPSGGDGVIRHAEGIVHQNLASSVLHKAPSLGKAYALAGCSEQATFPGTHLMNRKPDTRRSAVDREYF